MICLLFAIVAVAVVSAQQTATSSYTLDDSLFIESTEFETTLTIIEEASLKAPKVTVESMGDSAADFVG